MRETEKASLSKNRSILRNTAGLSATQAIFQVVSTLGELGIFAKAILVSAGGIGSALVIARELMLDIWGNRSKGG